jgi:hypothetical protein
MGSPKKPSQYTVNAIEKSCLFDNMSKAVLFDFFIEQLTLSLGESVVLEDEGFLSRLQKANANGDVSLQMEGFNAQLHAAILENRRVQKYLANKK